MLGTTRETLQSGQVVTLRDGHLALVVYRLAGEYLLLIDGELATSAFPEIAERPATCRQCGSAAFWWDEGHFIPWCLVCIPPDSDWRTETLLKASAFVDQPGAGLLGWWVSWLSAQDRIEARGWAIAQQFAFAGCVAPLVVDWYERHGFPE
jgi:hypothetical protein